MSKSVRTTIRTTSVSECLDGSVKVPSQNTDPKMNHKINNFLKLRKTPKPHDAVIICVSSRALFDMREGNRFEIICPFYREKYLYEIQL